MKTLAVMSRKGGTGKSTLTMCLGLAAFLRGHRVVIADADPQGSTAYGLHARTEPGPMVIETSAGKIHQVKYAAEVQGVDLLLVDTPGTADANTLHAVHAADLCLIVTRPNYFDIAGAVASATTIRQLQKPGLVVVNQAPVPRGAVEPAPVTNAREALLFTRLPVAAAMLRYRAAYAATVAAGRTPEETSDHAAAHEVAELWAELARTLGIAEQRPGRARA